jgi:hypothetical protein
MPSPAPCLLQLLRQVDAFAPGRSRSSDGIMGDPAHQARKSDHNQGNALDLTHSPGRGFDAGQLAESLRRQMASYPGGRVSYLIFNRQIASPRTGWKWVGYTGSNPHTTHAHISIRPALRGEARSWNLS